MAFFTPAEAGLSGSPARRDTEYYYAQIDVPVGAVNQVLDIYAALVAQGRESTMGHARYVTLQTDVDITVKVNRSTAQAIPLTGTDGLSWLWQVLQVDKVYFTHTSASSAEGDATVAVFAA